MSTNGNGGRPDPQWEHARPATQGRPMQSDPEAEAAVIGSMLISDTAAAAALNELRADQFHAPAHRTIFEILRVRFDAGQTTTDEILVREDIARVGRLEEIGGANYLQTLIDRDPTPANVLDYCRLIRESWLRRSVRALCEATMHDQRDPWHDAEDLLDRTETRIRKIRDRITSTTGVSVGDVAAQLQRDYEEMLAAKRGEGEAKAVYATGLCEFDDAFDGGFRPGELVVLAGRPGTGKTTLALNLMRRLSVRPKKSDAIPTAIFSLEMGRNELARSILCAESRIENHRVRRGDLSEDQYEAMQATIERLSNSPLYIDTEAHRADDLRPKARRYIERHGCKLIVIDYLQLLAPSRRRRNRQEEVAEVSRQIKLLTQDLEAGVLLLSQLNRKSEEREDRRPSLSDLRESGAIEQDADKVLLLWQHPADAAAKSTAIRWRLVKNRQGATVDESRFAFDRPRCRFEPWFGGSGDVRDHFGGEF